MNRRDAMHVFLCKMKGYLQKEKACKEGLRDWVLLAILKKYFYCLKEVVKSYKAKEAYKLCYYIL